MWDDKLLFKADLDFDSFVDLKEDIALHHGDLITVVTTPCFYVRNFIKIGKSLISSAAHSGIWTKPEKLRHQASSFNV